MSEQEEQKLFEKIDEGLKLSYENLLRRKAALGQDMVIADAKGQHDIAKEALRLAAQKLPVITKFVVRRDYDPSQNV